MSQRAQCCPHVCQRGLDVSPRSATAISILPSVHSVSLHHISMCLLPTPGLLWLLQPPRGPLVGLLPAARAGLDLVLGAGQSHILHRGLCSLLAAEHVVTNQQLPLLQNK